jgi:hypothetical protein
MIDFLRKYWTSYKLHKGLELFEKTGNTSTAAYHAMRQMFVLTRGRSNDQISKKISEKVGKYDDIVSEGVLGKLSDKELDTMVSEIKKNGFYIFDKILPEEVVNEIYNYALSEPVNYLDVEVGKDAATKVLFDPGKPISPRYMFSGSSMVKSEAMQNLIFDQSLLAFAQKYLDVKPILDLLAFWWSAPFNGEGKSAAAQMYHFDMDRIKFLKFFFYLTDVNTDTGPHCYVKASHTILPESLSRDGRFTDEEIEMNYGKDSLIEICGKKGTIIAVDTRGFHKGKDLMKDSRLLFQIEFANSMFGETYPPITINYANDDLKNKALYYPYTYGQLLKA